MVPTPPSFIFYFIQNLRMLHFALDFIHNLSSAKQSMDEEKEIAIIYFIWQITGPIFRTCTPHFMHSP